MQHARKWDNQALAQSGENYQSHTPICGGLKPKRGVSEGLDDLG